MNKEVELVRVEKSWNGALNIHYRKYGLDFIVGVRGVHFYLGDLDLSTLQALMDQGIEDHIRSSGCSPEVVEEALGIFSSARRYILAREGRPCFVRYGRLPKGGRSKNFRDNRLEAGVSVYPAFEESGRYYIVARDPSFIALNGDREVFEVAGEIAGTGSDGEPVLRKAKIVRSVASERVVLI